MSGSWPHLATACLCTHKTVQVSGLVPRQQNTAKKILLSYIDNGGKVRMMVAVNVVRKYSYIIMCIHMVCRCMPIVYTDYQADVDSSHRIDSTNICQLCR